MDFLIIICLISLAALVGTITVRLARASASDRLKQLKSFKKGKFAIIYVIVIPLYWIGLYYSGQSFWKSFLSAVASAIELVVLKFNSEKIELLYDANGLYRAAIIICYILVLANATMFAFTLVGQNIINAWRLFKTKNSEDKVLVIVGWSAQNAQIVASAKGQGRAAVVIADTDAAARDKIYLLGASSKKLSGSLSTVLEKLIKDSEKKQISVIINSASDDENLLHTASATDLILKCGQQDISADWNKGSNVYVFGAPENESAFVRYVEKSKGRVHYINKYKLIAMDFIDRFPITQFMDASIIDYNSAAVAENVQPKIVMIGFGKTGQQLFLTSVANNQLIENKQGGGYGEKTIGYFIYDRKDSENDKNLNHNFKRFLYESARLDNGSASHLPLPKAPADVLFRKHDINEFDFYTDLKADLTPKLGMIGYNYLIIAFGKDLENLDMAEKIAAKIREWGLDGSTRIFVKIRKGRLAREVVEKQYCKDNNIFVFGAEDEIVYSFDKIVHERFEAMAKDRHICYALEGAPKNDEQKVIASAVEKWYTRWRQVQREANIYACLSIRLKLQLMGFDYTDDEKITGSPQFFDFYQKGDEVEYEAENGRILTVAGKKIVDYSGDYFRLDTLRTRLAWQEHQRWNAYMIVNGYVPATVRDIEKLKEDYAYKDYLMSIRKHANLTTFDGLFEYQKLMGGGTQNDVIKYDYQIMDDCGWLLERNGFKIVARRTENE